VDQSGFIRGVYFECLLKVMIAIKIVAACAHSTGVAGLFHFWKPAKTPAALHPAV